MKRSLTIDWARRVRLRGYVWKRQALARQHVRRGGVALLMAKPKRPRCWFDEAFGGYTDHPVALLLSKSTARLTEGMRRLKAPNWGWAPIHAGGRIFCVRLWGGPLERAERLCQRLQGKGD